MKKYLLTILLVTNISHSVASDESFITEIHSEVQEITGSTIWNLSSNGISKLWFQHINKLEIFNEPEI